MNRSRGTSRACGFGARNLARVIVTGVVIAGSSLAFAGVAQAAQAVAPAPSASDDVWDQIATCESGGRWNTNTGNGYSGGLQFSPSTWRAYGGTGSASSASRAEQIAVAERVLAAQGWGAWPSCSRKVSARGKATPRTVSKSQQAPSSSASRSTRTEVKPANPAQAPTAAPSTTPGGSVPAPLGAPGTSYTVVAGDTLSAIAQSKNVPGGWQAVFERNRDVLSDPGKLAIGQRLNLG